ncbi:MAG TPA: DUF1592 domain-containing protein, partial [Planctomycetota bacterium]|nr:DUF1592 domain-containing protein [Planctomycetota bacterium]
LAGPMVEADRERERREGRSTWRRLNRHEYESTLRDLLGLPWLEVKEMLPEDGEAHRFNKVGDALDISHVQMAQYLAAAEHALRASMADSIERPATSVTRYYARDSTSLTNRMFYNEFNRSPERATFPVLGYDPQPDVRTKKAPMTRPEDREREAVGVVAGAYEPLEPKFSQFKVPRDGRYKLRLRAYSVWVGAGKGEKWWRPDLDVVSKGRRPEPIVLTSERPPQLIRTLGGFDARPEPTVGEFDVFLYEGETIRPDPARLFRSRPPNWRNPLAEKDGQPGVAYQWLEVEGPIVDEWPSRGHRLMFGDLRLRATASGVEVVPSDPIADAERLLRGFLAKAYRRPHTEDDVARFMAVVRKALDRGLPFAEAMIAGCSAVLCSPGFVCLEEKPGELDRDALASRLSYFLWNGPPDEALREADLSKGEVLKAQAERLLADPRSRRFREAFLDYWLDLRHVHATSPDAALYPDYYLDDWLVDSAVEEARLFFADLLRRDAPSREIVDSDVLFVNERLAAHYGLPSIDGHPLRRMARPPGSPRGGFLTMASVLKVTANGTTTSPVMRGVWVMERIVGKPPPPPPPSVPAVEPDIRGAVTIREQLDKHRTEKTCAACHVKIDPAGFALESFDVLGGQRSRYRALGEGEKVPGFGKNGQPFEFHEGPPVDAAGELPGGGAFRDIVGLKTLLVAQERQLARNMASQLLVYATGAPVRFGDRPRLEALLDRVAPGYGIRSIVLEIVMSDLFRCK